MGSIDFVTTKAASEFLNISTASLRSYAQHMEYVGYSFKKENNTRHFSRHDIELIKEAMERFKYQGGTMKGALKYVVIKEYDGEESARELDLEPNNYNDNTIFDVNEFKQDLSKIINSDINLTLDNHLNKVIEVIHSEVNTENNINRLKSEIEHIKYLNEQLECEINELKSFYNESENENAELRFHLTKFKNMGIFEFRKWKKEQ